MLISWTTRDVGTAPAVRWGTSPGKLKHSAPAVASSRGYTRAELCGAPARAEGYVDPGVFHTALMTQLHAGATYWYSVGSQVGLQRPHS
jgi:acid phosphatase type 7